MAADYAPKDFDEKFRKFAAETKEFLISESLRLDLLLGLSVILHGVISLAGVLSNSVNVLVFIRLGLKDSMSVGLWALSFTDLVVAVLQLAGCVSYLVAYAYPDAPIDPWTMGSFVLGWAMYVVYLASCWITTLIAIERCYCVAQPFRVKQVFTKSRCIVLIVLVYIIHAGLIIPIYIFEPLNLSTLGKINENGSFVYVLQYQMVYTEQGGQWELIINIVAGVILSVPSHVLIVLCSFWMVFALKASSRVRKHSVAQSKENTDNLSVRERHLVKVVIQLAIIQTVCNVPRFMSTVVYLVLPGILLGAYVNLSTLMWELSFIFSSICCASNIFVYLTLNSTFRQQFYHDLHIRI